MELACSVRNPWKINDTLQQKRGSATTSVVVSRDILYPYHIRPGGSNLKMVMPRKEIIGST